MGEIDFSESAWKRSWRDTWSGWKNPLFGILDAVVCLVVGTLFEWYWGLGLFLFAMFCVWIVATVRTPYKQRNEAREAVKILALATQPTEIVGSLLVFYDEATKLIMRKITTDEELETMIKDVDDWWKRCRQWVKENVSVAEWVLFSRVVANRTMKFDTAYNDLHNKRLEFLHYASEQLKQLILRFQQVHQIKGH